ncbi:MAG: hypothetical protein OXM88_09335 [bacterium]|nr:hypothetical protein [bacterium]
MTEATGWQAISSDTVGGIAVGALGANPAGLNYAQSPNIVAERAVFVRVQAGQQTAQWRMRVRFNRGSDYTELLSAFQHRATDSGWDYYRWSDNLLSDAVTSLSLETTSSAAHVGTSTYLGGLARGKVYEAVKDILVGGTNISATESDTAETVTLAGSPPPVTSREELQRLQDQTVDLVRGVDSANPAKNTNTALVALHLATATTVNLATATFTAEIARPGGGWSTTATRLIVRIEENEDLSKWQVRAILADGTYIATQLSAALDQSSWTNPQDGFIYRLVRTDYAAADPAVTRVEVWTTTHQTTFLGQLGDGIVTTDSLAAEVKAQLGGGAGAPVEITTATGRVLRDNAAARVPLASIPTNAYATGLTTNNNQFTLAAGVYDFVFEFEIYTTPSGNTLYVGDDRANVLFRAVGATTAQLLTSPYFRSLGANLRWGLPHRVVRVHMASAGTVHFTMQILTQGNSVAYLGVNGLTMWPLG